MGVSFLSADHYPPWANFHAEAIAIAGVLLGAMTLLARGTVFAAPRFWMVWVGCAMSASLLQWWLLPGIYVGDLVIAAIFLGGLVSAVALGGHVGQKEGAALLLTLGGLAGMSTLSALIGLLQWLSLDDILGGMGVRTVWGERVVGNLGQPNQFGTLLLIGLCAHAYLFERRYYSRFTFVLLVAVSTLAIGLTQSRTALLSATALTVFVFFPGIARLRIQRGWMLLWLVLQWTTFFMVPVVNDWLLIGGGGRQEAFTDGNGRELIWKQIGYAISQQPWLGYGWNRTATAHMAAVNALPGEVTLTYAHNIVLDFMAWYGVPVGLTLMGALAYWLWGRWRKIDSSLGACAFGALIPFVIHSLLEFPFAYGYFLMWAGVLAGLVEVSVRTPRQALSRRVVAPLLLVIAVLGVVTVYEYLGIEEDFRVTRMSNLRIGHLPEGFEYANIRVLTQMGDMLAASRVRPQPAMPTEEVALLKRVARRFPYGALTYRYVEALALNDQIDEAKKELRILRGLYGPRYYQATRLELAERGGSYPDLLQLLDD